MNNYDTLYQIDIGPGNEFMGAFYYPIVNGNIQEVSRLLQDQSVNPGDDNNEALLTAITNGRTEIVQLLLQDPRVDPTINNNYVIRFAMENSNAEIFRLLIQDPRIRGSSINDDLLLTDAIGFGNIEMAKLLVQSRWVNPDNIRAINSAIRACIYYDQRELLLQIINEYLGSLARYVNQIDPYREDLTILKRLALMTGALSDSNTDLMVWAAAIGSLSLIRTLIESGVDPKFADNSALAAAQLYNRHEITEYLSRIL